jgi:hypothetical protein
MRNILDGSLRNRKSVSKNPRPDLPVVTPARTDKTTGTRTVSGFNNPKTAQSLSFHGIDFLFPSYFDALDDGSTENEKRYYTKKPEYHATLVFFCEDLAMTQEDFDARKSGIVDSIEKEHAVDGENIKKSESVRIAGMPGWTLAFTDTDSTQIYSFVYNASKKKIIFIYLAYGDKDESNYDYLGDYARMLGLATVTAQR